MGDTFWMDDEVRVEWEESTLDSEEILRKLDKPALSNPLSFMNYQIKDFIFQRAQYPLTDTGSQILDPLWRRNIIKIDSEPAKKQVSISLN